MAEALIYIGDAATNTWRDGDVMVVRTKDGTFSKLEHRRPFTVIPVGSISGTLALEYEKTGVLYDVNDEPMPGTGNQRRKYRVDWKAIIAKGDGTVKGKAATEKDVADGKVVEWTEQSAFSIMKVR